MGRLGSKISLLFDSGIPTLRLRTIRACKGTPSHTLPSIRKELEESPGYHLMGVESV